MDLNATLNGVANGVLHALGIEGPAPPALTPAQHAAFNKIAANPNVQAQENTGAATAGIGGTWTAAAPGAGSVSVPSAPGLTNWLVGFGVLTMALLLMSEGKHTSELGVALGVVIAGTVALKDGDRVITEVDTLFGTHLGGSR